MKIYKLSKGWTICMYIALPFLAILACCMFYWGIFPDADEPVGVAWFLIPGGLFLLGLSIIGFWDLNKAHFIIDHDKIYIRGALANRDLALNEIKGFRLDDKYVYIEPISAAQKRIKVSTYLGRFDEIITWLAERYPDLDQLDVDKEYKEILANEELGFFHEERERKLGAARKMATAINWLGGICGACLLFYPIQYELAIFASILVAFVALISTKTYAGLIRIGEKKASAYPSIFWAFFATSAGLAWRALMDFELLYYDRIWTYIGILMLLLTILILVGSCEFTKPKEYLQFIPILLVLLGFVYGTLITLNCLLDNSKPMLHEATVLNKRKDSGKTTTYHLELTAWGPVGAGEEVSISEEQYNNIVIKDKVTVVQQEGKFKIPWFFVAD